MFNFIKNTLSNFSMVATKPESNIMKKLQEISKEKIVETTPIAVNEVKSTYKEILSESIPTTSMDWIDEAVREAGLFYIKGPKAVKTKKEKAPKTETIDSTGLIKVGKRGVTITTMISALKTNIIGAHSDIELKLLYSTYPEIFTSAIKYMPVKQQKTLKDILENN